jgi:PAS domain S-box-containing protein
MKTSIQPTDTEKVMRENDFIVSKTDINGRLTYGNEIFIEFSGYSEAELLGAQHNIIRHPDMPRGIFRFLWDTIAQDKEVFAYVKNLSKDGSFYWTFAHVTPDHDLAGKITGYLSVRRAPQRSVLPVIEKLYQSMLLAEQQAGRKNACDASLALLADLLNSKGLSYEEYILAL